MVFVYSWSSLLWYRCYYPHWSRDSMSPVCKIFFYIEEQMFGSTINIQNDPSLLTNELIISVEKFIYSWLLTNPISISFDRPYQHVQFVFVCTYNVNIKRKCWFEKNNVSIQFYPTLTTHKYWQMSKKQLIFFMPKQSGLWWTFFLTE